MEVQWIINTNNKDQLVHKYRRHMDVTDEQLQAYSGRTSLFREELQRGNISLKLRSVNVSDTNKYKCYIKATGGTDDASFEVQIHEPGNEPDISAKSHNNGSATLVCVSTNWKIKPAMVWMDGKGNILQQAGDPVYTSHDTTFKIQRSVTVQKKHGYNYTCRVSYLHHTKERMIEVERILSTQSRHHWTPLVFLIILFSLLLPLVCMWVYCKLKGTLIYFKRQVLQDYNATHLEHKHWPNFYFKPRVIQRGEGDHKNISLEDIFGPSDILQSLSSYNATRDEHCLLPQMTYDKVPGKTYPNTFPKVVILQGRSGYGKSFTAQKIVQDWASGADYLKRFDLVLLLKSEDLNQQMKNPSVKMELVELVCPHEIFRPMVKKTLMKSPHKVLFIIDGFDELVLAEKRTHPTPFSRFSQALKEQMVSENLSHLFDFSPFSPTSVEDHILALLSGHILPESYLLITSRPSALDELKRLIRRGPVKSTQIMGFSKDNVEQYFEKFFESTEKKLRKHCDISFVRKLETLSASCCIPGMCFLVCTFLKSEDETPNITEQETVTSIFLKLMISLVKQHYNKDALDGNFLKDLVVLAEGEKLTKNNRRSSKDLSDLKTNPFLCREPPQMQCRFTYRVFQEFFMALGYIIPDGLGNVETLLTELKEKTLNKNTRWFAMIRFLFGLSNPKVSHLCTQNVEHMTSVQTSLKNWICEEIKEKHKKDVRLFLLRCLYELHDEEVTKAAMRGMESDTIDLRSTLLNEVDCLVLQYCLQFCPNITRLELRKCHLTAEELKLLTPALGSLQRLWLDVEDLAGADVAKLISSLGDGNILKEHSPSETREVEIKMSAVKTLSPETVASLIVTFLKSKTKSSVSIEVAEEKNTNGRSSVCSSMWVRKYEKICGLDVEDLADADVDNLISSLRDGNILSEHSPPAETSGPTVKIRMSAVNLSFKTADNLIDTFLKSKKNASVSIEVAEEKDTNVPPSVCSSMSVNKDKDSSELDVGNLADADVDKLISSLHDRNILREHSEPRVKITLFDVKNLSSKTAANLIDTFLKSKRDVSVSIEVAEKNTNVPPSVCSSMSVNKDKDCSEVHVVCEPQQSGDFPTVSLMSLTMTPSEDSIQDPLAITTSSDSRMIWTDIMTSLSRQENVITDFQQYLCQLCDLKKARIIVNKLIQNETNELFSQLLKKCPKLIDLRLQTCKEGGEQIYLSLDKAKNSRFCLQVRGYSTEIPLISLILSERPGPSQVANLLSTVHSFGTATKDLDKGMDALLSSMSTLHVLKEMTLRVKCLTESWANGVIRLMQNSPTLQDVKIIAIPKEQIDPQDVCSSLSLKELDNNCLMVTADCNSEISNVSFTLPPTDAAVSECTNIVQQIHSSGKATEINVGLSSIVCNLLSLPWLEYVHLRVSCLTEIWTSNILSTINGWKKKIKVNMSSDEDDEEGLCSSISVERDGGKLRLTANNWNSTSYTTALSHISVLSEAHSAEWINFLQIFHTFKILTDSDPEVDGHLNDLVRWLCANGIKEINLKVSSLTESWAERIINLIQKCPSLENVSLSAGCNTVAVGLTGWMEHGPLEEDAIKLLKESKKNLKCNITISGNNPYTQKGNPGEPVEIKI
ncbi:uncharacterized protein LOC134078782 [Sardina pilchardus]|uniref:uncharacterized protein LOC134078782 n=1 Tax=Sardina pilchardus TaxID=27697 RepID=UPI002E10AFFF